jgi:hypothetical protein
MLTDERIDALYKETPMEFVSTFHVDFARAIEKKPARMSGSGAQKSASLFGARRWE